MIHTAELSLDRFPELELEFEVFSYYYDSGYPVDIEALYSVVNQKPQDENSGNLVAKITTTAVPLDEADVAKDELTRWVCSCEDFQHNRGVDLEEKRIASWGVCKHIQNVDPTIRAEADDNQTNL
jgi:hypothetical protein